MVEALRKRVWASRLTGAAALLCFGSVAVALVAAIGTGRGAWDYRTGLSVLRYAFFAAILGIVVAIIAALVARRSRPKLVLLNLLGILVAGGFVTFVGNLVRIARSVPASTSSTRPTSTTTAAARRSPERPSSAMATATTSCSRPKCTAICTRATRSTPTSGATAAGRSSSSATRR